MIRLTPLDMDIRQAVEREAGKMQWKPLMTEAEALAYTRGSYYEGISFYHGTSKESAAGITAEGARLSSSSVNTYGDGFYLAFDRDVAIEYAIQALNPAVVTIKVYAKNPKKFANSLDVERFCVENDIPFDDYQDKKITRLLISQGFDAIEIGGDQILVVIFDKRQIAVFRSEELSDV